VLSFLHVGRPPGKGAFGGQNSIEVGGPLEDVWLVPALTSDSNLISLSPVMIVPDVGETMATESFSTLAEILLPPPW
jgi:hypothetical protein